jgi:hypothetical protein
MVAGAGIPNTGGVIFQERAVNRNRQLNNYRAEPMSWADWKGPEQAGQTATLEAPPVVEQQSLSSPVTIPGTTTLSALLALLYNLSSDLTFSSAATGNTTSGSNSIASLSTTTGFTVGMTVTGAGIPAGSVIINISGTTVTISQNATATATGVALTVAVVQNFALIDGSLLLLSFTHQFKPTVRIKFEPNPGQGGSTLTPIYSY